ncbi:MAG: flagellar basal-body MS-ring/collar protein FliF [Ilumatobacter sp.]|uniref:flagellar basal-body MS-ring/collar protein FliF n=1 Tax=Ilumatobacter sp. TaxID=1967498 RepID=UPI00391DA59B
MAGFDSNRSSASGSSSGIMGTVTSLSPLHKVALGAAVLTLVAGFFVFTSATSGETAMAAIYTDLEARDAASVTDELMARNVEYELADGGRTVMVPRDDVYDLRIALSGEGLPASNEGYALLDRQGITTSEFRQRIDYQRALEGELSKTLRSIEGVRSATVHLALPEDSVFVDEPTKPTASVLVGMAGSDAITADQVAAMVHLVAASVKNMEPQDVTIADSTGRVLTDGSGAPSVAGGGVNPETDAFETNLASELRAMVGRVTGFENVAVNVEAELELTERQATSETYDTTGENGVVLGERVANETYTGIDVGIGGEAGVLGPDGAPIAAAGAGAGGETSYVKDDAERTFAVNRTVEQVTFAPGAVTRLSVAVLVDEGTVTAEQSEAIAEMVSAAAGIDAARGDQVSVTRLPFSVADPAEAEAAAAEAAAMEAASEQSSMIRTGIVGFVALLALILAYRSARRARREVATPIDIGSISAGSGAGALPLGSGEDEADRALTPSGSPHDEDGRALTAMHDSSQSALDELSSLADRRPEEIAQILQDWLADDKATT